MTASFSALAALSSRISLPLALRWKQARIDHQVGVIGSIRFDSIMRAGPIGTTTPHLLTLIAASSSSLVAMIVCLLVLRLGSVGYVGYCLLNGGSMDATH